MKAKTIKQRFFIVSSSKFLHYWVHPLTRDHEELNKSFEGTINF